MVLDPEVQLLLQTNNAPNDNGPGILKMAALLVAEMIT